MSLNMEMHGQGRIQGDSSLNCLCLFVAEKLNQECSIIKVGGIQDLLNIRWTDGLFSVLEFESYETWYQNF
jgi:hypothetical protein